MSIISTNNLPHTATVFRRTFEQTEGGGTEQVLTEKETGIKCWVQLANMREKASASKLQKSVTHKIYFNYDFEVGDLEEGDAIRVTDTCTANKAMIGLELRFQVSSDASAGLGILFKHFFEEFQIPHVGARK